MFPNYFDYPARLRLFYKPGTGHVLTALVDVPWHPGEQQRLPVMIDRTTIISLIHADRQITISEIELLRFWHQVQDAHRVIDRDTGIVCESPHAVLTGSLQRRGEDDKIIDMVGGPNESQLFLVVSSLHVDTKRIALLEPLSELDTRVPAEGKRQELALKERETLTTWIKTNLFDGRRTESA